MLFCPNDVFCGIKLGRVVTISESDVMYKGDYPIALTLPSSFEGCIWVGKIAQYLVEDLFTIDPR
ncbi:hypothetical protein D3C72_2233240 [compost metagenome]